MLCEGGFSNGSSAAGVRMQVKDKNGRVLMEASMNENRKFVLDRPRAQRIRQLSEGQRGQVVLVTVMAQDPDLLILHDYSTGLDAGYRQAMRVGGRWADASRLRIRRDWPTPWS